jgi:signal transduction histidine kinase
MQQSEGSTSAIIPADRADSPGGKIARLLGDGSVERNIAALLIGICLSIFAALAALRMAFDRVLSQTGAATSEGGGRLLSADTAYTELSRALFASFTIAATVLCVLTLCAFSFPAWAWYRSTKERQVADRARAQLAQDAEAEHRWLQGMLVNMPHGLCIFDSEKRLVLSNARYAEMYNLPPNVVRPGATLQSIIDYRHQIGNAPKDFPNYVTHEGLAWKEEGNNVFEFALEDGRAIRVNHLALIGGGYVATHEDMTNAELEASKARAATELAESRAELVAELERKNRELEMFCYSVSHDLRTPLRGIDGFSHAILEDCGSQLDELGKSHLNRIRAAARRMGELIDDLLQLSRVTRAEMTFAPVDLSMLAHEIIADLQRQDKERTVDVRIEEGLVVEADLKMMRILL